MRTLPFLTLLAAALCGGASARAQAAPAKLELNVVDASTGAPLPGVRVEVANHRSAAQTNERGMALLRGIPAGPQYVKVARLGYEASGVALLFSPGDSLALDVNLAPAAVELDGVVARVTATQARLRANGFYDRQHVGLGKYRTEKELAPLANQPLYMAIQSIPGVFVSPVSGGRGSGTSTEHWAYSPRSLASGMQQCFMSIYLDGVRQSTRNLDDIPTDIVGAVEVYSSAANIPAEYNATGSSCGVILLWTKSGY